MPTLNAKRRLLALSVLAVGALSLIVLSTKDTSRFAGQTANTCTNIDGTTYSHCPYLCDSNGPGPGDCPSGTLCTASQYHVGRGSHTPTNGDTQCRSECILGISSAGCGSNRICATGPAYRVPDGEKACVRVCGGDVNGRCSDPAETCQNVNGTYQCGSWCGQQVYHEDGSITSQSGPCPNPMEECLDDGFGGYMCMPSDFISCYPYTCDADSNTCMQNFDGNVAEIEIDMNDPNPPMPEDAPQRCATAFPGGAYNIANCEATCEGNITIQCYSCDAAEGAHVPVTVSVNNEGDTCADAFSDVISGPFYDSVEACNAQFDCDTKQSWDPPVACSCDDIDTTSLPGDGIACASVSCTQPAANGGITTVVRRCAAGLTCCAANTANGGTCKPSTECGNTDGGDTASGGEESGDTSGIADTGDIADVSDTGDNGDEGDAGTFSGFTGDNGDNGDTGSTGSANSTGTASSASSQALCGNRQIDSGEQCDTGPATNPQSYPPDPDGNAECGNGVAEGYEQCDDGNSNNNDGCSNSCTVSFPGTSNHIPGCNEGQVCNACQCQDAPVTQESSASSWSPPVFCCTSPNQCSLINAGDDCPGGTYTDETSCMDACRIEPYCCDPGSGCYPLTGNSVCEISFVSQDACEVECPGPEKKVYCCDSSFSCTGRNEGDTDDCNEVYASENECSDACVEEETVFCCTKDTYQCTVTAKDNVSGCSRIFDRIDSCQNTCEPPASSSSSSSSSNSSQETVICCTNEYACEERDIDDTDGCFQQFETADACDSVCETPRVGCCTQNYQCTSVEITDTDNCRQTYEDVAACAQSCVNINISSSSSSAYSSTEIAFDPDPQPDDDDGNGDNDDGIPGNDNDDGNGDDDDGVPGNDNDDGNGDDDDGIPDNDDSDDMGYCCNIETESCSLGTGEYCIYDDKDVCESVCFDNGYDFAGTNAGTIAGAISGGGGTSCTDGIIQGDEECDYANPQCPALHTCNINTCECELSIALGSCGDGNFDAGEQCDDGNNVSGDGCSSQCITEIDTFNSSSSLSSSDTSYYNATTRTEITGDYLRRRSTQTRIITDNGDGDNDDGIAGNRNDDNGDGDNDDGIANNLPGIPTFVASASICGNGLLEGNEECDDSNRRDDDGCSSSCFLEVGICGDGIVQSLLDEQCESITHDPSLPYTCENCRFVSLTCGDARVDPGEECDDGALNSDDADANCRTDCSAARCGDGILDAVELCDDGNRLSGDGCDRYCREESTMVASEVTQSQQDFPIMASQNAQFPQLQQFGFPQFPTVQPVPYQLPLAQLQPLVQGQAPAGDTGPAAVAVIGAGAAAGWSWMRRKRKK